MDPHRLTTNAEWVRGTLIAQRFGRTNRPFEDDVINGRLPFRWARFGVRQMLYVYMPDVNAYRARLLAQQPPGVPA